MIEELATWRLDWERRLEIIQAVAEKIFGRESARRIQLLKNLRLLERC